MAIIDLNAFALLCNNCRFIFAPVVLPLLEVMVESWPDGTVEVFVSSSFAMSTLGMGSNKQMMKWLVVRMSNAHPPVLIVFAVRSASCTW